MITKTEIKLGMEVKDIVTGITGIATSRTDYLNGCVRYCIEPKPKKDGSASDSFFCDEQQLVVVKAVTPVTRHIAPTKTGGARPSPRGPKNPPRR